MENLDIQWLDALLVVGWIVSACLIVQWLRVRARRRTYDLKTTAAALTAYYDAMEKIADDPALPTSALEFLDVFAEVISDRDACNGFTSGILQHGSAIDKVKKAAPDWANEIEEIGRTRPDIEENFHAAVASGIVALFLRWPGNSWKFHSIMQLIAADRRKEALLAERIVNSKGSHKHNGDDPLLPGGLVAAC